MWKPGSERPKSGRKQKGSSSSSPSLRAGNGGGDDNAVSSAAKDKAPSSIKTLSSGTMNMRFMQRTVVSPKQVHQAKGTDKSTTTPQSTTKSKNYSTSDNYAAPMEDVEYDKNINDEEQDVGDDLVESQSQFVAVAAAEDMYGPTIMGRRSFGGFHASVEKMYQQSIGTLAKESSSSTPDGGSKHKRKRKRNK